MRSVFYTVFAFCLLCLASCGDGTQDSESSYKSYWEMIEGGDEQVYDDCFCHSGEDLMQNEKEIARLSYVSLLDRLSKMNGGLKSMSVKGSTLSENGKKSTLRIVLRFNDGSEQETEVAMWLCADKWKINLDY